MLAHIGEVVPFGAAVAGRRAAWVGQAVEAIHVTSLALITVASSALAAWRFRWD